MSLSNTNVGTTYACNGVTTSFAIPFAWQNTSEIKVYLILISTGVETLLTLTTNYTYSPSSVAPTSIVTVTAYSNLYKIRVERATPVTQTTDWINNSSFLAEDLEESLDKIVQIIQEINAEKDVSLKLARTNYAANPRLPLLVADALLSVNPTGDGFVMGPTLTAFAADVAAAAASAAAALVSQNAAAASASAASSSQGAASVSAAAAAVSQVAAASSEANALVSKNAAAASAAAAAISAASFGIALTGSRAAPQSIVAGTGIAFTGAQVFQTWYVQGNGGAVTVTANPAIAAAGSVGQKLRLIGRSDTNTLTLNDGNGLDLNGPIIMGASSVIDFEYDGTNWLETSRR